MRLYGLGVGATALTVFFAMGCSDTAAPAPRGGLYFHRTTAAPGTVPSGKSCNIPLTAAQIGSTPPTAQSHGSLVTDGENGAQVSCAVNGSGTIKFNGQMIKGNVTFTITGGTVQKAGSGTMQVVEYDPDALTTLVSPTDTPCNVHIETPPLGAVDGKIWALFDCPALISDDTPSLYCAASGDSVFYFDNCD
jgi:hypothetical protein